LGQKKIKKPKKRLKRNKMGKKVCKKCRIFVKGDNCPVCKGNQFSTNWQGRINILDADKSMIAEKLGIKAKGEYAIKVR